MGWDAFKPNTTITPEQKTWCADNLDRLSTKLSFKEEPVELWTSSDGVDFRLAFRITVAPAHDDRFVIQLLAGASKADLDRANRLIKHTKAGMFNSDLWRPVTFKNGYAGWSMGAAFPDRDIYHADELKACKQKNCVAEFHPYYDDEQADYCALEEIRSEDQGYTVYGELGPGGEWYAWADAGDLPEGPPGLKAVRDLTNDFAWMQGECDRLNNLSTVTEAAA